MSTEIKTETDEERRQRQRTRRCNTCYGRGHMTIRPVKGKAVGNPMMMVCNCTLRKTL